MSMMKIIPMIDHEIRQLRQEQRDANRADAKLLIIHLQEIVQRLEQRIRKLEEIKANA